MKTIRNESSRAELIRRVNALENTASPLWGRMNVEQMLSHLAQTAEWPFGHSVPDSSNLISRTLIKTLVVYFLPVPKEVKTAPQVDQQRDGRRPQGFDTDRALVIDGINKLGTLPETDDCCDHPFFGKMSAKQWALLAHKHIDHHLKQFGA